jgi:hypothetical protein
MRRPRPRRERGVAAVELALILPLFCLMLFGLIDYGYYFMVDLAATNAVREGARAATTVVGGCPNAAAISQGTSAIATYLSNVGLGSLNRTINTSCTTVGGSPAYQFSLRLDFQRITGFSLLPMPASGLGGSYTAAQANATMRGQ